MVLKLFALRMMVFVTSCIIIQSFDFSQQANVSEQAESGYINVYIKQSCYTKQRNRCTRIQFSYIQFDSQHAPSFKSLKQITKSIPMYVDQETQQTVFKVSDQVYIFTSLMNYYDDSFALGNLLINGYATLSSDCSPMIFYIDLPSFTKSDFVDSELPKYNYVSKRFDSETNPCKIGYSLSPQDKCVNLLNDFYNCGSFGYVCEKTFKTCSGGKCSVVSPVQLSSSDILTDWIGSRDIDDSNITVSLPFEVKLYDQSSSEVTVTTNGIICLGRDCPYEYENTALPSELYVNPTVFCHWDDMRIFYQTSQGVYYSVVGTAPNRTIIFEYNMGRYESDSSFYHFQVKFYENQPGVVECVYLEMSDSGESATIGVQKSPTGPQTTVSFNTVGAANDNTIVRIDTNGAN